MESKVLFFGSDESISLTLAVIVSLHVGDGADSERGWLKGLQVNIEFLFLLHE